MEKIFSQRGKLVGNYVSCCGPADGTVTASRSPRVSPAFLATESRHMEQTGLKMSRLQLLVTAGHCIIMPGWVCGSASKMSIQRLVITEKAPTRAFSWLKAATTAFTFKTLLRHYAKRALTQRSLNVKLGPRRNYHKGRAVWLAWCLISTHP